MDPKKITAIPATVRRYSAAPIASVEKRRVAGYARASTDRKEQQTSFAAQLDYYKSYIASREDWEFAGMYSDKGLSATSTTHREGFKMLNSGAASWKA
ncbi:MAG: recombinase family protein [Oscillospiraceae bacterium]|nr:recombinase family protein [Oscillospiraceae bacterium]